MKTYTRCKAIAGSLSGFNEDDPRDFVSTPAGVFLRRFLIMAQIQVNETQIVSGTEIMRGVDHTRQIAVSIPRFASRPDITISIYSDDNMPPAIGSDENANPGTMFAPWAIEYRPEDGIDGMDRIVVSAANTQDGMATPVRVMCSYIVMGEIAKI
jgi:hypothetical protein